MTYPRPQDPTANGGAGLPHRSGEWHVKSGASAMILKEKALPSARILRLRHGSPTKSAI
jgi:hypothetical protein